MTDEYRPDGWNDDMEKILQFVRQWRIIAAIEIGSEAPPLDSDSGNGFILFSALPREPDLEGMWWREVRQDASLRSMILWRIMYNPQPVLEGRVE